MGREVKRVPVDFDWPQRETWIGYLNPFGEYREDCPDCKGTGLAPAARRFANEWYGNAPFDPVAYGATPIPRDHPRIRAMAEGNVDRAPAFYGVSQIGRDRAIAHEMERLYLDCISRHWSHHLVQADVDALIAARRLLDFTHRFEPGKGWQPIEPAPAVTADEVNAWSIGGMGHDSINQSVCVKARCAREGVPRLCATCDGHGDHWPTRAHKALYEAWTDIDPPTGDGWQMWEDTSEGSPISPVFATPEELARWLADSGASAFGSQTATYEQWLSTILRGWAPSAVGGAHGLRSGVAALAGED